jgi:membrane dipeptidase
MSLYPEILGNPIVCDMTLPQSPAGPLETPEFDAAMLARAHLGITFTSVTIASDELAAGEVLQWIAAARRYFLSHPSRFVFVDKAADIETAHSSGKTAVNLHFQGSNPLMGNLNLVEVYRRLGVGHLLLAYNYRNLSGDGCHEASDAGLSQFGKELIAEMQRVGMVVDLSHTGTRTAMDAIELSMRPVILSHSNSKVVFNHDRNVPDHLVRAVAATGGVIGVNGVGLFLSAARQDISVEAIAAHAQHYADLVGPEHVGIGLDAVPDVRYFLEQFARKNPSRYRVGGYLKSKTPQFAGPEIIPQLAALLLKRGWSKNHVLGFLGENWLRVVKASW